MTALRPFRWLPHDGKRHAVKEDAFVGQDTATLCGVELTIPAARPTSLQWCWPTCVECDTAWRRHEGIPLFPRQRATTPPATRLNAAQTAHARQ